MELAPPPQLVGSLRRWLRPWLVATLIVGGLAFWVGPQLNRAWFDRPLPDTAIQAHQLRVNSGQLQRLTKSLDAYQHPTAPTSLTSTTIFSPVPKT